MFNSCLRKVSIDWTSKDVVLLEKYHRHQTHEMFYIEHMEKLFKAINKIFRIAFFDQVLDVQQSA